MLLQAVRQVGAVLAVLSLASAGNAYAQASASHSASPSASAASSATSNANTSAPSNPASSAANITLAKPPAPIPYKHDSSVGSANLGGGAVGILLISLAAIGLVLWARKKLNLPTQATSQGRSLRIVESQRLGPRAVLSVIEFDGRRYLIAQGEQGITCLVRPEADAAARTPMQEASHA